MAATDLVKKLAARAGFSISRSKKLPKAFADQQALLQSNPVNCIFDVGASNGSFAINYRNLFPDAKVWAFEPFQKHFEQLVANTKSDPSIKPVRLAISDVIGSVILNVNRSPDTNSILPCNSNLTPNPYKELMVKVGEESADSITIDRFTEINGISAIDILKMDIQGAELRALQGADRLLREKCIGLIYCEVQFRMLYDCQPLFADLAAYLNRWDYRLVNFYNGVYCGIELQWADAIFCSSKIPFSTSAKEKPSAF